MFEGRSSGVLFLHGESNMYVPVELTGVPFFDVLPSCLWLGCPFFRCRITFSPINTLLKETAAKSPFLLGYPGICGCLNSNEKDRGSF